MACSLGAMSATVHTRTMASSSGLTFKDTLLLCRRGPNNARLSSFVHRSLSTSRSPLLTNAKRVLAISDYGIGSSGSWNSKQKQQQRSLNWNPLDDSEAATSGWAQEMRGQKKRRAAPIRALAEGDEKSLSEFVARLADKVARLAEEGRGILSKEALTTGFFFLAWYFFNVVSNIFMKKLYNYFPYPYFASAVYLLVGVCYCVVSWGLETPKRAPIDKDLWLLLAPVAACHALGHVMTSVSVATVAVSFTHTIKSLEAFFNAAASQFILGEQIPIKLWLSLAPIVLGVSAASLTELSFNWTGFISAMTSNIAFSYRNIYSKKAMTGMDSTNVYAYISILALAFCIPPALILEGPALMSHGFADAVAKVGLQNFLLHLFCGGMCYHLYNQLANNTLERVTPLTHAVGNVLKRVFVIGFSIIVFGNQISSQTGIGTAIAIAGVAIYSAIKADLEEEKRALKKAHQG